MGEQRTRLEAGEWYLDDAELQSLRRDCWRRLDRFNGAAADDDDVRDTVLRELLGDVGADVEVVPRFQCSYGYNIRLGDRAFVNANAFFMDDAPIRIGADVRMGPGAQLVTALHPIDDPEKRREGWERALPIEIGSNVWLGTSVTVGGRREDRCRLRDRCGKRRTERRARSGRRGGNAGESGPARRMMGP